MTRSPCGAAQVDRSLSLHDQAFRLYYGGGGAPKAISQNAVVLIRGRQSCALKSRGSALSFTCESLPKACFQFLEQGLSRGEEAPRSGIGDLFQGFDLTRWRSC